MGLVSVMGHELSSEMIRAAQLARKLRESEAGLREIEERMRLAVEGADFGIWIRDLARNELWATDKWRGLFGFTETERLELGKILQRIHFEDRDAFRSVLEKAAEGNGSYDAEYRVVLPGVGCAGSVLAAASSSTVRRNQFSFAAYRMTLRGESKLRRKPRICANRLHMQDGSQ